MSMASAAVIISSGRGAAAQQLENVLEGSQINDTSKSGKTVGQPQ